MRDYEYLRDSIVSAYELARGGAAVAASMQSHINQWRNAHQALISCAAYQRQA
jgi:hypothetical protein